VNLADLMNELADDVDTRALPEPDQVRGIGDRLRRRHRSRLAAGVAAVAVAVAAIAVAVTAREPRSAPEPAIPAGGLKVVRTVDVPGSGAAFVGAGSLWVVDMAGGSLTDDGTAPTGDLYELDPESGQILDRIPGAVGGWPAVGGGAVWLCTAAGGLDVLTRVDLATHEVTRITTSHPRTLPHGVAVVGDTVWVASTGTGELLLMDPESLVVRQRIRLGGERSGRAPQGLVTDGASVWVSDDNGVVSRFDGATGVQSSRLQLPAKEVRLDGIDAGGTLYANTLRGNSVFEITTGVGTEPDTIGRELSLTPEVDSMLGGLTVGPGSVWAATVNPDQLLRVDPQSLDIIGHAPISAIDHESNVPVAVAASNRAVWVRVDGKVVEVTP
jgi:glutamine cyclotransferase